MSQISVASGWQHILQEAMAEAAALPDEWCFEITKVETKDGAMKLSATYVAGDVPLDDHLPPSQKIPHPFRAMLSIREKAREKSLVTCECCGRPGQFVGAGQEARVRCPAHVDVLDAVEWSGNPVGFVFYSAEEAMAHFLADYGDGLDVMKEMQAAADEDSAGPEEGDPETRH